jgi:hypothetical protein
MLPAWALYMTLTGAPVALHDSPVFNTESACQLYVHTAIGEQWAHAFGIVCRQRNDDE